MRARELRRRQTRAELKLWQRLRNRRLGGFKFRRQEPVDRFIVDFVCIDARLIVEVDGATHGTDAEVARDGNRSRILESLGFLILRFHNADVFENIESVLDIIVRTLDLRGSTPSP